MIVPPAGAGVIESSHEENGAGAVTRQLQPGLSRVGMNRAGKAVASIVTFRRNDLPETSVELMEVYRNEDRFWK